MIKTLGIIDGLLTTDRQRRNASRSLGGKTVIEWVARQMTDSLRLDGVVVMTDHSEENIFVKMITPLDVPVIMTNAADTMSALSTTLDSFKAEHCVYIGLDWPLIDSNLIDRLIIAAESNPYGKYAAFQFDNESRKGRPLGMFAEWYDVKALHRANRKATDPIHREFPGLYFLECVEKSCLTLIPAPQPFCEHDLCLSIESEDDWDNVTMIFESIDADNIRWHNVAELLLALPSKGKGFCKNTTGKKTRRRSRRDRPACYTPTKSKTKAKTSRPKLKQVDPETILELNQVSKQFGGVKAVRDLTVEFKQGKITAIIGPNGAGKTTAFNLISGLLLPDSGSVTFKGTPLLGKKPWHIASLGIGRLFQDVRLFRKMTVLENIMTAFQHQEGESLWRVMFAPWTEFKSEARRKDQAISLLEKVGLVEKAETLAENLSYGQQKLVAIARMLAADTKLLLLDEPTSGVNPVMIRQLLTTIKQLAAEGRTIIFVEHNMEVVRELADWVIFMSTGKMMTVGNPHDVLANPKVRAAYIGRRNDDSHEGQKSDSQIVSLYNDSNEKQKSVSRIKSGTQHAEIR